MSPETLQPIVLSLIAVLIPLLIQGLKGLVPKVPKILLPIFAVALGPVLEVIAGMITSTESTGWMGLIAGAGAVVLRDLAVQLPKMFQAPPA